MVTVKTSSVVHTWNLRDGDQHGKTTASIVTYSKYHVAYEKRSIFLIYGTPKRNIAHGIKSDSDR